MKRYGSVIRLLPEKYEEYKQLHAAAWPSVLSKIAECNIRDYTIYYRDGLLFSHFVYVGDDYEADCAAMAADPETQRWWALCEPCQKPVATAQDGVWWAPMEELFHCD